MRATSPLTERKTHGTRRRAVRPLARIVRRLRQHLPELRETYHIKSLGIFGSYVRGEQKPRSDVDVLVEYSQTHSLYDVVELELHLSKLLGVQVDLANYRTLKPYIGKRILREVLWLQKDGAPLRAHLPRRKSNSARRKTNGAKMEPKREYLDYLQDMLDSMAKAQRHIADMTYQEMLADDKTLAAVQFDIQVIGEAASRIPAEVRKKYPQIPWQQIINMRHRVVHGYDAIDYETIWDTVTQSIPRDQPLVTAILETEKQQRGKEPPE
jgi:uncharacterized protein with HEPN domain/predicted nucleotidyltransferase